MYSVIRKKDKELETTRKQAQIGKRNDTTSGGDTNYFRSYRRFQVQHVFESVG